MNKKGGERPAFGNLATFVCVLMVHAQTSTTLKTAASRSIKCGNGYCNCSTTRADCRGRGLTFIPALNSNMTDIDLSLNILTELSRTSWDNVTAGNIQNLNIKSCHICSLTPGTFVDFQKLQLLRLDNNPIITDELASALVVPEFPHLSLLHISGLRIRDVSFLLQMKTTKLSNIYLNNNNLTSYNHSFFSTKYKNISLLSMNNNRIRKVTFSYSGSLLYLELKNNHLTSSSIPDFCNGTTPYFPKLKMLNLDYNTIKYVRGVFNCLPELWHLGLNGNPLHPEIASNSFINLSNLKVLWLANIHTHPFIKAYAFNNSQLQQLLLTNLMGNAIRKLNNDSFNGLPNLFALDLSRNSFKHVSDERMLKLFGHLDNLRSLTMGHCFLNHIPSFLNKLRKLTNISFFDNNIKHLPDGSFSQLYSLRYIGLDKNFITIIKESTIPQQIRKNLVTINFADNSFICDCDLQWFIDWTRRNITLFQWYPKRYTCNSPASKKFIRLEDIYFGPNSCILSFTVISSITGTSAGFVLAFISFLVFYKLRWRIRHYIYMNYHRPRQLLDQENAPEYVYDAYIIHSEEDEDWVVEEMLPRLEDHHELKLCIPSRDFLPGTYILHNIDEAIQTSRHIVVVLSPSFVESEWCQAELTMAQSFILDTRGNPLLAVVLEEPDARNMRHSLHVLLRSTAYMIWGEEEEARQLFWRRLVETLRPD